MAIALPDLHADKVDGLMICGSIKAKDKSLRKWAASHERDWYICYFGKKSNRLFCRVTFDKYKDRIHFHTDLATKDWFSSGKVPEETEDGPEFEKLVAPTFNLEMTADVSLDFRAKRGAWPSIMALTQKLSVERDGLTIKMTGGTLSVEGAPVNAIFWAIDPKDDTQARVSMRGAITLTMSENYIQDFYQSMKAYSDTFFEKEKTNA
jgi:hypothetical protein